MYYLIAYDISNNRLRLRVAKLCRKAGFLRLQRSVFIADTAPDRAEELRQTIQPLLPTTDRFALMPLEKSVYEHLLRHSRLPEGVHAGSDFVAWDF